MGAREGWFWWAAVAWGGEVGDRGRAGPGLVRMRVWASGGCIRSWSCRNGGAGAGGGGSLSAERRGWGEETAGDTGWGHWVGFEQRRGQSQGTCPAPEREATAQAQRCPNLGGRGPLPAPLPPGSLGRLGTPGRAGPTSTKAGRCPPCSRHPVTPPLLSCAPAWPAVWAPPCFLPLLGASPPAWHPHKCLNRRRQCDRSPVCRGGQGLPSTHPYPKLMDVIKTLPGGSPRGPVALTGSRWRLQLSSVGGPGPPPASHPQSRGNRGPALPRAPMGGASCHPICS